MMNPTINIRLATLDDVEIIFRLIENLAEYENLSSQMTGDVNTLKEHLFGEKPYAESVVAQLNNQVVGYALFFPTYSTFLTKPGLYLEDLFVLSEYRRQGIGKAMLSYIINLAQNRDYGRLEWSVLDWNQPAIDFYQKMGAEILPDWRTCRIVFSTKTSA